MNTLMRAAGVVAFVLACSTAYADSTPQQETNELVQTDLQKATGADHLGDSIDLYSGSLSMSHTDVSLPGNTTLKVALTRRFATGSYDGYGPKLAFGSWELDVPKIETLIAYSAPWPSNRCSSQWLPPRVNWQDTWYERHEYWHGFELHLPGMGSRMMMKGPYSTYIAPTDTKWVASGNIVVSCTPNGAGYIARLPDGTRYTFDWLTSGPAEPVWKEFPGLTRYTKRMLATKVEDRFGNYVKYNYNSSTGLLDSITGHLPDNSPDGRRLDITWSSYNGQSVITTVTAVPDPNVPGGSPRVWTYQYANNNAYGATELSAVVRPDSSRWQFSLATVYLATIDEGYCNGPASGWVTSPFGLTATYAVSCINHGHAAVGGSPYETQATYPVMSVASKALTGPGLTPATQTWTYDYSQTPGWYTALGQSGSDTKWMDVTDPGGVRTRYTYNIRMDWHEGNLESIQVYDSAGVLKRNTAMTYEQGPNISTGGGQIYRNQFRDEAVSREVSTVITQSANWYRQQHLAYDGYKNPTETQRWNEFSTNTITEHKTYKNVYNDPNDPALWVIGELESSSVDTIANPVVSKTFNAKAQPVAVSSFGLPQVAPGYDATTGLLISSDDPVNPPTNFGNYYRGKARLVTFPDNTTQQVTVNNEGTIASFTDERTNTTSYQYDSLNRLTRVTFPTGDTQAWLPRDISYWQLTASELDIPVNSWRMRTIEGNFQKTIYYDAQLNPVLTEEKDTSPGGAVIYVRRKFDHHGRMTFQSYPSTSYTPQAGIVSSYDTLGRIWLRQATPDGSAMTTIETVEYLSGNSKRVTDADGKTRTTTYQAFDTPDYSKATLIQAMEGQTTTISRNVLGKITSVTQSGVYQGNTLSATRSFEYDERQRPCRRIDPESGSTIWGYDLASQTVWEARGQSGTGCLTSPPVGATAFTYDARGRKTADNYTGTGEYVGYGYDLAGNLTGVSNTTAVWTYWHNKRDLLETEQAVIDGSTLLLNPEYNNIAHLDSLATPARTISYSPDAWGRPNQLSGYVTGIQYHPSGAVSNYGLASGLSYSQTLDWRLRPSLQSTLDGPTTVIQKYQYGYTAGGDLLSIDDQVDNSDDATLAYDDLHRLETASNTIWGAYTYEYDPLNNLRARTGSSALAYTYDASNRLSTITGSQSRTYSYNANGEITGDGAGTFALNSLGQITSIVGLGGGTYAYDGNGRRIKVTKTDGTIEYALYSRAGVLVYTEKGAEKVDYLQLNGQMLVELKLTGGTTTPLYLHPDFLGSPRKATNDAKAIQWQEHYDPYGKKLNGVVEKVGYTGHAFDVETGFTYMQARFYDAAVGRFLSTDPIHFVDENPFTFNRYSYVSNNPYRYVDPTGMIGTEAGTTQSGDIDLCSGTSPCDTNYSAGGSGVSSEGSSGFSQAAPEGPIADESPEDTTSADGEPEATDLETLEGARAPTAEEVRESAGGMEYTNTRQLEPGKLTESGANYELIIGEFNELGNIVISGTSDPSTLKYRSAKPSPNEAGTPFGEVLESYGIAPGR